MWVDFVPDELRQEAGECGEDITPQEASVQMRTLIQKGRGVPSCVVDGVLFSSFEVPDLEQIEERVQQVLPSTVAKS